VPLCRVHHRAVHRARDERVWWQTVGIDPAQVARKLWNDTRIDEGRIEPDRTPQAAASDPTSQPGGDAVDHQHEIVSTGEIQEWQEGIDRFPALRNRPRQPLLAISGEQGSAKTVLSKMLKALVDPNAAPVRALPREERELMNVVANCADGADDADGGGSVPLAASSLASSAPSRHGRGLKPLTSSI
jgi:hypothetical protein